MTARPSRNTGNVCAAAVTRTPRPLIKAEAVIYARGEKILDKRPPKGVTEDIAIRYVDVNHETSVNASREEAMVPEIVVKSEMLHAGKHC